MYILQCPHAGSDIVSTIEIIFLLINTFIYVIYIFIWVLTLLSTHCIGDITAGSFVV